MSLKMIKYRTFVITTAWQKLLGDNSINEVILTSYDLVSVLQNNNHSPRELIISSILFR